MKKFFLKIHKFLKSFVIFLLQTILLNFLLTFIYFLIFPFFKFIYLFEKKPDSKKTAFINAAKDYNNIKQKELEEGS
ncbi:MAG: hypothetical protein ACQESP_08695 [Candidatus Muiribacteriota bacterium]